jgi:hypothetical protein
MVEFLPARDMLLVRKVEEYVPLVVANTDPTGEEVFEVLAQGPEVGTECTKGDYVCIVGYLHTVKFKGVKALLTRAKDVICIVKEA